jgi:Sulfotransferase family
MMTGLFANAGYFAGDDVRPADQGNSRGYFESEEVNRINEDLLDQVIELRPTGRVSRRIHRRRPRRFQRWAARPKTLLYDLTVSEELLVRMKRQTRSPFCLKDPRFCWTLPAWREPLGSALRVCIFRHPAETVESIIRLGRIQRGLRDYPLRRRELLRVWRDMYSNALRWSDQAPGEWVFIDYDDVLQGPAAIAELAELSGASLSAEAVDASIRSVRRRREGVPRACEPVYAELGRRAISGAPSLARPGK